MYCIPYVTGYKLNILNSLTIPLIRDHPLNILNTNLWTSGLLSVRAAAYFNGFEKCGGTLGIEEAAATNVLQLHPSPCTTIPS